MKYAIAVGHTASGNIGCGVVGKLNESNCTREIAPLVLKYLKQAGEEALLLRIDKSNSYNYEDCYVRASLANNANVDRYVEIHINSGGGTGTEVLVNSLNSPICEVAKRVSNKISQALNIPDRGVKQQNLIVLKRTSMPAMLIECCFADDPDASKYNADIIAKAIVEGLLNRSINTISQGWNKSSNNKWWYCTDVNTKSYYKSEWKLIDGFWYLFDSEGFATTGWVNYGQTWYYLDKESCKMATYWNKIDGEWYYFNDNGEMQTGWIKDKGRDYCLYSSGQMIHDTEMYGYSFSSDGVATKL